MRNLLFFLCSAALIVPLQANADSDKDERGHGRGHGHGHHKREYKEEYWDGNCKVERKYKKDGEYKEKRECKGPRHGYVEPAPAYVPVYPPARQDSGITINGTIRIP